MKRLVMILGLIWLLALAACDTMGPQVVEPTDAAEAPLAGETTVPVAPTPTAAMEVTAVAPSGEESSAPGSDLLGTTWEWVSVIDPSGQTTATDPARYTITFNTDGTAAIKADCNSVTSTYLTDGTTLSFTLGASTAVGCPEDTQDQLFLNSLASSTAYIVQDGELLVTLAGESGTMIFRPGTGVAEPEAEAPALTGVTWEWVESVTSVETVAVVDPTRYTITFNDDGSANVKADCNSVLATYTTDETGGLTLTMGPSTLAACPPDSQVDILLSGLGVAGAYSFDNGDLLLTNTAADGGVLRFRATGATQPEAGAPSLAGTWEWVETVTPVETIVATDPTRYQITFAEDGTAGIVADCNVGNATYTTGEDGAMTITLGVSTLAFCENSQDQVFRTNLAAAAGYFFEGEDLLIDLMADAGTMRFRQAAGSGEGEAPASDTLTGVTWQWVATTTPVETITAADPSRYTILFNEDGTADVRFDCNTGTASYTTGEGNTITITPGATTLMACPADSQAAQFSAGLEAAALYFFQDGDLYIDMFASGGTMQFTSGEMVEEPPIKGEPGALPGASGAGLVGTTWQLNLIEKRDGNITVNDPTRYTVVFNEDGSANFQADCNVGGMAYTLGEGNSLTLTQGPMTLAFCGAGSLDQIFLGGLANAMGYRLEEGNLVIDMLYDSGSLVFSPAE